ncbi:MAG: hypothetical protein GTO63_12170 [Anaerolineae bacterium]|nr:hypothetical protein [Anaerolineae bacterium]NIN95652.1 hypothetical protein [Anaerolineae bacterium]NIQ78607.1 hypothetical protein [Anaerolineae bacterium]
MVVNHGQEPIRAPITSALSLEEVRELAPGAARRVVHDEHQWKGELEGFCGTVFYWRAENSG